MPIRVSIDPQRRLAACKISGPVTGQRFVHSVTTALRSRRELADYDIICDITGYTGDVAMDDLASIAMLMNDLRSDASGPARTALITHDDGFATWAQVMGHQFARRRFGVFGSREAARAWLQAPPEARQAA
jgi:hypothetical protein